MLEHASGAHTASSKGTGCVCSIATIAKGSTGASIDRASIGRGVLASSRIYIYRLSTPSYTPGYTYAMCRFLVFKGTEPLQMSHLVTRPRHSITNQAFDSKLRNPSTRPFNADGFGIGWYDPLPPAGAHTIQPQPTTALGPADDPTARRPQGDYSATMSGANKPSAAGDPERNRAQPADPEADAGAARDLLRRREEERELENERPCLFKSISPAWSNANLTRLAEKIRSPLVFAHVRASTLAGAPSEDNCHPWIFSKLMWMHNGEIHSFHKIKRALQSSLPDELYLYPSGYTDSEWAFMLFLSKLKDPHARSFTHVELREAMCETIKSLNAFAKAAGVVRAPFACVKSC